MKKLAFILLIQLLIFAVSCKEKVEEPDIQLSAKGQLLTGVSWEIDQMITLQITETDTLTADVLAEFPCYGDNLISFTKQGEYVSEEGDDVCYDDEPLKGTWEFNRDETALLLDLPDGNQEMYIGELTEDHLVTIVAMEAEEGEQYLVTSFESR